MTGDELDPGAPTAMFQAFMDRQEPEASRSGWAWASPAAVVLAALGVAVWLVLG